jgi:hypothetical protein
LSARKARSVEGKFPKRNGQPYIIAKGLKKEGFGGWSGVVGFFSLAMDSWAFSGELFWFAPLLGRGNNFESIYYVRPK